MKDYLAKLIALILLSLFLIGCSKEQADVPEDIVRPAKIAVVKSSAGEPIRHFPATVEPTLDAQLAFRVNGELAKIHVVAGQEVQEGEVLAYLDDKDFSLNLKQAQAKYDLSLSQYNRSKKLFEEKLVASSVYDEAKAQLDIADAQLDSAKTNLKYTKLVAPFAGTVAQLHVENFEFVQAKQPIMELQGRDTIDVAIQVPENLMAQIPRPEQGRDYQPSLIFDAKPGKAYKTTLKEHDITPNPATKSYKVVFSLPTPTDINILSGMTGKLEVEMSKVLQNQNTALLVPVEAVFVPNHMAASGKQFVYTLTADNKTQLQEINVLRMTQKGAEIAPVNANLKVGDRVIAAGSHYLEEGQQVRAWTQERGL